MVDAEDEEVDAVGGALAVLAGAVGGGKLIRSDDVLGAEVARAEAVGAGVDVGHFCDGEGGQALGGRMAFGLNGLRERGADVAAQWIVAGEGFVGALQDDDVLLALERGHDGGFGEGANDVDVDGADASAAGLAQVVDRGLDVFGGRAEGDEDGVGVFGLVLG